MHAPINIFWTGGWDSTFRILYLVLVEKKPVQPYYIIDTGRKSTRHEIKAMETIRQALAQKSPESASLIHAPIIRMKQDIGNNHRITRKYQRLASVLHLGTQYEWIALFADHFQINDLELALIKRQHKTGKNLQGLIAPNLLGIGHDCRLKAHPDNKDLSIFQNFRFPLIGLTKQEIEHLSRKYGFIDLMENTWYCFRPTAAGLACGRCVPCKIARQSGHSHAPGTFLGAMVKSNLKMLVHIGRRIMVKLDRRKSNL